MRLYAKITKANGKTEGLGDNEGLAVDLYHGNKIQYSVYIEYCNVGDIEEPTMDSIITVRDWRAEEPDRRAQKDLNKQAKKQKDEKCFACGLKQDPDGRCKCTNKDAY